MSVQKGQSYDWYDLLEAIDAEDTKPPFALHRDGYVVGFALNRWQNPQAPAEILVGPGESREKFADIFIAERPVVPVLVKEVRDSREWRCVGHFKLVRVSADTAEKNTRVRPFDIPSIYKILFMEEVSAPSQLSTINSQPSQ